PRARSQGSSVQTRRPLPRHAGRHGVTTLLGLQRAPAPFEGAPPWGRTAPSPGGTFARPRRSWRQVRRVVTHAATADGRLPTGGALPVTSCTGPGGIPG